MQQQQHCRAAFSPLLICIHSRANQLSMLLGRNYPIGPNHPVDLLQAMVIEVVARATYSRGGGATPAQARRASHLAQTYSHNVNNSTCL